MTCYETGDTLRADVNAQGLIEGETYTVHSIDERHTPFGTFVTYHLQRGGVVFPVRNAHLLCSPVKVAGADDITGPVCHPAVRAFRRAMRPVREARALAAWADRGFDGGEWSDALHDEAGMAEERAMAAAIAPRFGLSADGLLDHYEEAAYVEGERAMAARFGEV